MTDERKAYYLGMYRALFNAVLAKDIPDERIDRLEAIIAKMIALESRDPITFTPPVIVKWSPKDEKELIEAISEVNKNAEVSVTRSTYAEDQKTMGGLINAAQLDPCAGETISRKQGEALAAVIDAQAAVIDNLKFAEPRRPKPRGKYVLGSDDGNDL